MTIRTAFSSVRRISRRFVRDERGVILALMTVFIMALISVGGLAVETGLWYALRRQQQNAADFAAVSGAMEIAAGKPYYDSATTSGICGLARRDAARNNFTFASYTCPNATPACTTPGSGQMCANHPPVSGAHVGNANYIEVILGQQQNTMFASLFLPSVMIRSRAVAGVEIVGSACTLALNNSAPKTIDISGNTTLNMNGCGLASNSTASNSVNFQGSATLNASWFQSSGSYNTNGNPNINVPLQLSYTQPVADPYSCDPPTPGCAGQINWSTVDTALAGYTARTFTCGGGTANPLQPGKYTAASNKAAMELTCNGTTVLCPGVYALYGADNQHHAFNMTKGTVQMGTAGAGGCPANGIDGVTIISTGTNAGRFTISGGTITLSAPTNTTGLPTSLPSGLLFVQDPTNPYTGSQSDSTFTANGTTSLKGAVYTKKTDVNFTGNSNSTCFRIIADQLNFTGNSTMSGNQAACTAAGVASPVVLSIALAE